jgi:uncharacterized phage protein (TIGR02218 family)
MSYLAEEQSVESGRPIRLFRITMGSQVFRYTSAAEDVVNVAGADWAALPIQSEEFTLGSEDREQQKAFTVPGDEPFVQNFVTSAPSQVPIIEVLEFHFGDASDPITRWRGEVVEVMWLENGAWCSIVARPPEAGLEGSFPRMDDGLLCPYMLYDSKCQVAEASFTFAGTASAYNGGTVVVSGLDASKGVGWARSGKLRVVATGEVRMILDHTATDTLRLGSPFPSNINGLSVQVLAGCDRLLATCHTKFANAINFGGKPYMPLKDPKESFT